MRGAESLKTTMMELNFKDINMSDDMRKAIEEMGFENASPIQSGAIPFILEGKDVIGQAQTGTGKTAAFGIPLLEMIDPKDKHVTAVILCPTRELSVQVANELKKLAKYKRGINILPIYGGESIQKQILALKRGVQVIVGTPGRVIDHLERKTLRFEQVKMAVLDEADEMLNMGFRDDIESILKLMPKERQTVLFSATMPKAILDITHKYQRTPEYVKVTPKELTASNVEQVYYDVKNSLKLKVISTLVNLQNIQLALVFCNTKSKVDDVVDELISKGHKAAGIHGDLRQAQRNQVLGNFRNNSINILVATDVAARGIDVSNVDVVFNFDLPYDPEQYVHRIGRTARAGKSGKAISFTCGRDDMYRLRDIERYTKVRIDKKELPSQSEIMEQNKNQLLESLTKLIASRGIEKYQTMINSLVTENSMSVELIAAALLKNYMKDDGTDVSAEGNERRERPVRERSERGERSERPSRFERPTRDGGRREDGRRERTSGSRDGGFRKERPRVNNEDMTRLFLSVGKKDNVNPGDILGAIAGESNIDGNNIGAIDIFEDFTFVDVSKDVATQVIDSMDNNKIKGKKVNIEVAKARGAAPRRRRTED